MADPFNLTEYLKSYGFKDGVMPTKLHTSTMAPARANPIIGPDEEEDEDTFASEVPERDRLRVDDLYKYENINTIREYMTRAKGVDYQDAEDEKLVTDFMDHMRWFNTNTVSTAGEVMFITRGSEEDKRAAGDAYQLYDRLGSVFVNDGFFGAVSGIKDYVFAAAADPTNYIGVLTGGLGKASALGVTQSGKAAIRKAASAAATRAATSQASRTAASQAATAAAEEMARKMVRYGATDAAMAKAVEGAARAARSSVLMRFGQEAAEGVIKDRARVAGKAAVLGTTAIDALIAGVQTDQIQQLYLDVGAQEEYSRIDTALSTLLGGIGGGLHLAFGKFEGVSGLGEAASELRTASRAERYKAATPMLSPEAQKAASDVIKKNFDSWTAKVTRGGRILGNDALPESLLKTIMLGDDGKGGLAKVFKDHGYKLRRDTTVSDVMTNVIRYMTKEDMKGLYQMSRKIHAATGIHLGDLDSLAVNIGDLLARDISRAGGTLSVMSQVRRTLDGGVVAGNEILNEALDSKEVRDAMEETLKKEGRAKVFSYGQNVWKRLLVSSPATTAANVAGFGQFAVGQTIADIFSMGQLAVAGIATGSGMTKTSRELFRKAGVYKSIQAQKMRNLLDPFTTHDAYMEFLDNHKDVKGLLFETVGAGVERSAKRYNIDPKSKAYRITESITTGATEITGVRVQDSFTKSQMFMTELDKGLRLKSGTTLSDVMRSGKVELIDDDIISGALDTTMKSVFSKDYTTDDQMLRGTAKMVEQISNTPGLGTVLPFGRFMNNVVATAYQWGPLSLIPAASRIVRKSTRNMSDVEALSRSLVGTSALGMAMHYSEEQEKKGLAYNEIDVGGGTIVDVRNLFPFSFMLAAGRYANLARKGEAVPKETVEDLLNQLAIGQVARDTQFANDLYNVFDYFTSVATGGERGGAQLDALFKTAGNIAAGTMRPLDAVNRAVGFMTETDYAKDPRQATSGGALFTQQATKYVDNIFEALLGESETLTGERLRVASRQGDLYDANPLARILGVTVKPGRTATEKVYSLAEMKTWTADSRTRMPHYDRIFNETLAPILETKMNALLRDQRFKEGDVQYRRDRVNTMLKEARATVRDYMDASSGATWLERMRYKASTNGTKEQQQKAMMFMRQNGVEVGIEDFNFRELQMYNSYIEYLKHIAKGY